MAEQRFGSAKKNFPYHNALILHKNKKQTVKDQLKYIALMQSLQKIFNGQHIQTIKMIRPFAGVNAQQFFSI